MTNIEITRVQCEHYDSPLGIEEASPRLSWRFSGLAKDWLQARYEIKISRTLPGNNSAAQVEEYKVDSNDSVLVPWPSKPLEPQEAAHVQVRAVGNDGSETPWTSVDVERGLSRWSAVPVTCEKQPTDAARRPFRVRSKFEVPASLKSARLYVTALGVYEAELNGGRVGDEYLAPGWTSYKHHLVYRTYDVSSSLQAGATNVLGAWVAEGWYAGRLAFNGGTRNNYGTRPAFIAQLVIDGKVVVATDKSWSWAYGAILDSQFLDGETWDSNLHEPDWTTTGASSDGWKPVETLPLPATKLVASQSPPVRAIDFIGPQEVITTPSGKTILDLGQNFAGVITVLTEPPVKSGKIVFRYAEVLEHGELGVRPLRGAKATDTIILGGKVARYEPKFTSHGFRYVEVTGWPGVGLQDIVGVVTHSAMAWTGTFNSSHKLVNRLHKNICWSAISNTISIPTDCPQRDERLGWSADCSVFTPTLSYLFDGSGFLTAWLKDLYVDQQTLGGNVPVTIPDILDPLHNQPLAVWGDTAVLTPYDMYQAFGDLGILRQQYASAKLWLDKGVVRDPRTDLWHPDQLQLSDWLAPKAPPDSPGDADTDTILVANAYLVHTTRVFAKIASLLGETADAAKYDADADRLTDTFYAEYITPNGRVMSDTQTGLALLLRFGIYPKSGTLTAEEYADKFGRRLGELAVKENWKVATGFAGTPLLLDTLEQAGQLHHAYRMLQSRDTPSFLSPILLGATTIWERWDSMLQDGTINPGEMTSFNHYALGAVAQFLHRVVGGLSPLQPGWREVLVKPQPGGTITSCETSHLSPYGQIECAWKIVDGKLEVDATIPLNTTARIELPGLSQAIGSGKHHFSVPWTADPRWPPTRGKRAYGGAPSDNWEP